MGCSRGCGQSRGAIRPSPSAPSASPGRSYSPGVIVVRAGSDLFSELVLTSVVRDLPNREFLILNGTLSVWEQFHNARASADYGAEAGIVWSPLTPLLVKSLGHDVFQIAADRFRALEIVVDRGPSLCHLPTGPMPGRTAPSGVLLDLSGTEGTVESLPTGLIAAIESGLSGSGISVQVLTQGISYGERLEQILGSEVVICTHGPTHLLSCGAHLVSSPEPPRKTILLAGGAWPSSAVPGRNQVTIDSWHTVSCSNNGCGSRLVGPGAPSTDRCANCPSGFAACLENIDPLEVVSKLLQLLSR